MNSPLRVAIIGFGAIGRELVRLLGSCKDEVQITAVLRRSPSTAKGYAEGIKADIWVQSIDALLRGRPELVVECAGHEAVGTYGPSILSTGAELLVASVGALADFEVERSLRAAALNSRGRILIPSGAAGALDALASARNCGLSTVIYRGTKSFAAWRGVLPDRLPDAPRTLLFFSGTAREAALRFPRNANVAAAIALAGLGFDATQVELIAQEDLVENQHEIFAEGEFGSLKFRVRNRVAATNPRTSVLTAGSLAKGVLNRRVVVAFS